MNIVKNKRIIRNSINYKLVFRSTLLFVVFIVSIIVITVSSYSNYVTNYATNQNKILSEQVLYNYETYFQNIIDVSNSIQDELYNSNAVANKANTEYFDNIISIKKEIKSIGIYGKSGNYITGDGNNKKEDAGIDDWWLTSALKNPLIDNFSAVSQVGESYRVILSRKTTVQKGELDCILRMELDFTSIVNSIYQVDLGTNGHIVIYDKNYYLVYTSSSTYNNSEKELLQKNVMGTHNANFNGHNFLISQYTISNTTWRVAVFSNYDTVNEAIKTFITTVVIVGVCSLVIFLTVIILLIRSITKPLRKLQLSMGEVEKSEYLDYKPLKIKGTYEIEELNNSYNDMMKQINKLMKNVVEEQNNQRKSEFKALTNQINPHFLYNTLDSIIYLIDEGKNDDAQTMVLALSKFFRISISKGRVIIPLHDELEHIKNYLIIQKMRYKDSFEYSIKVEAECENIEVIKLILQPIVENAIYHGIKEKSDGKININCYKKYNILYLSVKDNGFGITESKIEEIKKSFTDPEVYNGVGIKNVYQRLKIYYGNNADVTIESLLDIGTNITLVIPLGDNKNEM